MAFFPPSFTGARTFWRFTGSALICTHLVVSKSNSAFTSWTWCLGDYSTLSLSLLATKTAYFHGVSWPSQVLVKTLLMSRSWGWVGSWGIQQVEDDVCFAGSFRMMASDFSLPDDFKNKVEIGRIGCFLFVPLIADWILLWTAMNWKNMWIPSCWLGLTKKMPSFSGHFEAGW